MALFFDTSEYLNQYRTYLEHDLGGIPPSREHDLYRNQIQKSFDKKFIMFGSSVNTEEEALKTFLKVNARMARLNNNLESYHTRWSLNLTLRRAKLIISHILGPSPLLEDVFQRCNHSSGTTVGVRFIDTSLEAKMKFPMSGTASACRLWEHYKKFDWEFYNQACNLNEVSGIEPETVTVVGSRAATVPKSNRTDRMIAVEPTLNMFFQQGLLHLLDDRLRKFGLDKRVDQERHRRLAFMASVTCRLSTVDFSSASDSLSLALCHFLLPKGWYSWLFTLRCHRMIVKDQKVTPHMISTMGNATTFPLETLVLFAIGCASIWTGSGRKTWPRLDELEMSVYGDDCILPTDYTSLFIASCELAGFSVNHEKTYIVGDFKESCGGDFYRGRDVRPSFLESLSRTEKSRRRKEAYLYTTINGVIRMYIKYFGTVSYLYDKSLLRFLFSLLAKVTKNVKFVPEHFPEDSGICSLRDIDRFLVCYRITPSRVGVSLHGNLDFEFLRFRYPFEGTVHEGLRYTSLLRKGIAHHEEDVVATSKRRRGGYYVASKGEALVRVPSTFYTTIETGVIQ